MKFRKMMSTAVATTAAGLFALASINAMAHTDEYLDTQQAPNGGQLRMAGVYHFELVVAKDSKEAKNNPVIVYVTDHAGAKVSTVGANGTVTILAGKAKATVNLTPDGDNRLKGSGTYASTPDMKAVVSVTLAGKAAEQARFTPLAMPKAMAQDGHADHKH
jgi:hypothetical protein